MKGKIGLERYRIAVLIFLLLLILMAFGPSLGPKPVWAEASYTISISVDPSSGEVGDSFKVTATVRISGLSSGTAYVVLKTVAPDGSYSYYASSARDVAPFRQWGPEDMPVSMTYSWTVIAEKEGIYASTIEITIDGDARGGFLKDSKSATFKAYSSSSSTSGSVNVSVYPSSVQKGESVSISVTTTGFLPPNPRIYTYVYPPGSSTPAATYSGTGTFTYLVPSDGVVGTWKVSSLVKDERGNIVASNSDVFSVISDSPPSSNSQQSSVPEIWISVDPNPADIGDVVTVTIGFWFSFDEYYPPNPVQIKIGDSEWMNVAYKHQFTPTSSGALTIWVKGYFDRKSLPGSGFGRWMTNSTTLFVRNIVALILEYPKKVHVGDMISITARLMCNGKELQNKPVKVFVDEGEFLIHSSQSIVVKAERPGTIDVSALFEGDQEYSPAKNGGGLIEVWTKPLLKLTIGAKG